MRCVGVVPTGFLVAVVVAAVTAPLMVTAMAATGGATVAAAAPPTGAIATTRPFEDVAAGRRFGSQYLAEAVKLALAEAADIVLPAAADTASPPRVNVPAPCYPRGEQPRQPLHYRYHPT